MIRTLNPKGPQIGSLSMYQTLCNVRMNNMHVCVCVSPTWLNVFTSTETSPEEEVTGVSDNDDCRDVRGWGAEVCIVVDGWGSGYPHCPRITHWRRAGGDSTAQTTQGTAPLFLLLKKSGSNQSGDRVCQRYCGSRCRRTLFPPLSPSLPLHFSLPFLLCVLLTIPQTPGSSQFYLTSFHFSLARNVCNKVQDKDSLIFFPPCVITFSCIFKPHLTITEVNTDGVFTCLVESCNLVLRTLYLWNLPPHPHPTNRSRSFLLDF